MTDIDRLKSLLDDWGVPHSTSNIGEVPAVLSVAVGGMGAAGSEKVTGYVGFYTSFDFAADGSFVKMGAWE